jgi:amidase
MSTTGPSDLCFLSAVDLARKIRARDVSAVEVMEAHLDQIEKTNPAINAINTFLPELGRAGAIAADQAIARGRTLGPLHGLPIAHKDLAQTAGIRTTYGSPIYKDYVPTTNDLIIDRLQGAGAITIGKTNTPEFGAGSQSFNPIFGATRNPYDLTKTAGGSSGGAGAALAAGMIPIADGSDSGGSIRNPSSFNNVTGIRPSPGRVPNYPARLGWSLLGVHGPLARNVEDLALLMSVLAEPDARSPLSLNDPGSMFLQPLARDFRGVNVAWSRDLGMLKIDPCVTKVLEAQRHVFTDLGCEVFDGEPDFRDADEVFRTWRAWGFESAHREHMRDHRDLLKDTIIWNTEAGEKLTGPQLARAEEKKTELYHRVRIFMETYEYLLLPTCQLPPFDVTKPYPTELNGEPLTTYLDWMGSCYYITVTGHPAASVPCGFTDEGLPVGLQIVGRRQNDFGVLQLAYAFEQATGFGKRRPEIASGS